MNTIEYLKNVYGYDTPIILKNLRIGGKSNTAIRQDLCRAYKKGLLDRYKNGVYYFDSKTTIGDTDILAVSITFEDYITKKYMRDISAPVPELLVYGYYSGLTFLNMIGISQQVPATLEITTNNTSSKKREIISHGRFLWIRKSRTEINFQNWQLLQFLDMFHFLCDDDFEENKQLLVNYIKKCKFTKNQLTQYIKLYSTKTMKRIFETELFYAFK